MIDLELPTWKEAKAGNWHSYGGIVGYITLSKKIAYICLEKPKGKLIFKKQLTYKNYIKACRLCKKLLLDGVE